MGDDVTAVIALEGLSVRLGGRLILDDLQTSLTGRAIGLLGPNGAGKTTLLRTLLGFFKPSGGTATVLGHDLGAGTKPIRSLIGYMPESDGHIANLTAVRFVRLMAELSGVPSDIALERAHEALFYVGLGEARYRLLGTFSTGMKQKAKLAQAIVHGPRLLFLDEPTNGLDPPARKRMLELVCEIRDQGETQIVLSSHLLRDVELVCDEVVILNRGRLAANCDLEAERRANRSFVELEVVPGSDGFVEAVTALGCETAVLEGSRMKIVLPDGVTVRDLYATADSAGVAFRSLDCKRDSLQDIFLRAMEDSNGGV
jgi:ABC-2 type transport system ATP-binding protein